PSCRAIRDAGSRDCEACPHFDRGKSPLNLAISTPTVDLATIFSQVKDGKLNPATALMKLRDQGANIHTLLRAINVNYAVVKYGGQTKVATIIADDISFMKVEDFHRMFANQYVDPIHGIIRELKARIGQIGNGVFSMTLNDFHESFADLVAITRTPTKLSRRWFEWKGRRQYLGRGVVFEPGAPLEIANDM